MNTSFYDWSSLDSASDPNDIPIAIKGLLHSKNDKEASHYYWMIDNNAILQGTLYESSYPAICCVMDILYESHDISRVYFFEIISQIASGFSEDDSSRSLKDKCMEEISFGIGYYMFYLRRGGNIESSHCADILKELCCWKKNSYLKDRFVHHLSQSGVEYKDSIANIVIDCFKGT